MRDVYLHSCLMSFVRDCSYCVAYVESHDVIKNNCVLQVEPTNKRILKLQVYSLDIAAGFGVMLARPL